MESTKIEKITLFLHFFCQIFGHIKKSSTFALAFGKEVTQIKLRAFSSAGLEHLPYKQRVGGSNPSTPTTERGLVQTNPLTFAHIDFILTLLSRYHSDITPIPF